jgi:class 3 adenylate cyclase
VNTGGPIIAGVLGTDKPVFDIIGDPINIAARLQSTCLPNRVQISEDTYNLLKDLDFTIEPRGEIFLKGKGKRPAFLIIPAATFPFAMSVGSSTPELV